MCLPMKDWASVTGSIVLNPFTVPENFRAERCTDAPANSIFSVYFECYAFWSKAFHVPVRGKKRERGRKKKKEEEKKGLRISNFALLLVVFRLQHGSDGVNTLAHI